MTLRMIDFPNALSYYEDMKECFSVPPSNSALADSRWWKIALEKILCLARFLPWNIQVLSSFFHLLICLSFIRHLLIVF